MTIPKFIEKALEGGWKRPAIWEDSEVRNPNYGMLCQILLDPLAWHAVGIIEMWRDEITGCQNDSCSFCDGYQSPITGWEYQMHRMIDALAEGKTIEQYLETL